MLEHGARLVRRERRSGGFTMIEVLLAIGVLTVGVMGLVVLVPFASENNYRTRIDTTATFVAMRQLEQMLAQPMNVASFVDASDDTNLNPPGTVSLAAGGAQLDPNGNINFTQPVAAVLPGYRRIYRIAQAGGDENVRVNIGAYDVRWRITEASGVKTIVVAAMPQAVATAIANGTPLPPGASSLPANVRAVKMK